MRLSTYILTVFLMTVTIDVAQGRESESIANYFDIGHVQRARLSPDGSLISMQLVEDGQDVIRLINLDEEVGANAYTGVVDQPLRILNLEWIDDRQIVFQVAAFNRVRSFVVTWQGIQAGSPVVEGRELDLPGRMMHPLPNSENEFIWQSQDVFQEGRSAVYRVDLSKGTPYRHRDSMIAHGLDRVIGWVSDDAGQVRIAMAVDDDSNRELLYRDDNDSRWRHFLTLEDQNETMNILGILDDRETIFVLSDRGHDTVILTTINRSTGKFGDVLHEVPGRDIESAEIDWETGEVIAVSYVQDGRQQREYLDEMSARDSERLQEQFPETVISVIDQDRSGELRLLYVSGERDPGSFWFYNAPASTVELLGERLSEIDKTRLAVSRSAEVFSEDGLLINYLVTPPVGVDGPYPLVVMPHGGPIGVRDVISFNPAVQHLASHGFGVLRVNFRGSAGFGREFREAGYQEIASGIEMDIRAAMDEVLAQENVDPERVCIAGTSYGGFSALVSAIQNPDRYRCAASHVGVYDIPLIFSASDSTQSVQGREALAEIWGDYETDLDEMVAQSPLYQVEELNVPVRITHNRGDRRVSVDQAYRLRIALEHYGKDHEWEIYDIADHGFLTTDQSQTHYENLVTFLRRHLGGARRD